ncbi:MAG TPA: CDP-alcohol phosphatidyltransferase family protein [Geminicoccaceae bacterium]|nr:CDP-alcohol phosphatidyltransferase family protein [Geminicoccaceae bacterium]
MASIYDLKSAFQRRLRPTVQWLALEGVTANQVTLAALLLSLAYGLLVAALAPARWPLVLMPLVLFARMALNAIDGMLAREHGMASRLGALLNELGDVVADAALYLPLALLPGVPGAAVVLFVVLAAASELAGVLGATIGGGRRYDGPMGKSDRAFAIGLLALLLGLGVPGGSWLALVLWVLVALVALTVVHRCQKALAEVGE